MFARDTRKITTEWNSTDPLRILLYTRFTLFNRLWEVLADIYLVEGT